MNPPPPTPPPGPPASRLVAIWVPDWPVVALTMEARQQRRHPRAHQGAPHLPDPATEPVAVVGARGVLAASAPARRAGITTGMRLRTARSLCPELTVLPPQEECQARAFETVMEALTSLLADPMVARPGLALSGVKGPAAWIGGEEPLASALVETITQEADVECQVGIADSLPGAVLAARQGIIVEPGRTPEFLAPWPLDALLTCLPLNRLQCDARPLLETFTRLGLRTLADLAALPRKDVTARFGPLGDRLHHLASGTHHEAPAMPRPTQDITVTSDLDPPIERADTAAFAARHLAENLATRLLSAGLSAGHLCVAARCEDGTDLARTWMLEATPTPTELIDRVRWQLEGWLCGRSGRPPSSGLTHLSLTALELNPATTSQAGLWQAPGHQAQARAHRAAERVESLLGAGSIQVPKVVPGRDPRSRVHLIPWGESEGAGGSTGDEPASWSGALPEPSPSVVLPRPVPARLTDLQGRELGVDIHGQLDGVPGFLSVGDGSGGVDEGAVGTSSQMESVLLWAGPWPVDEGWWTTCGPSRRAYLQVVTDVGPPRLLVRSGRWWLDALYS
ncbi:DNA polymerase Y family protein [Actinomyces oris]|uniref:ImpB/MucB/SamB family protein n=1 Tax=Actinomyces oris TaxID=544580 RepID=A0A1Q8HYN1_9ACTO|nr:DNA polymerase Y family protein [Actinomyces oris]OLL13971.1 ImpB/MucB/SamB family protein [Actinomyces oris]